jgi:hypothetical protein
MQTPSIVSTLGVNQTLIATFTGTPLLTSNVNWFINGTAITSNGVLTASPSKYNVFNNGSYFTLTIFSIAVSDFTSYQLIHFSPPITFSQVNATISQSNVTTTTISASTNIELATASSVKNCETSGSTTAILVMLVIGYLLLVVTNSCLFLIASQLTSNFQS